MDLDGRHYPNTLKRHRNLMGYSREYVAYLLNHKNVSQLSLWENGRVVPNLESVLKLSIIYSTMPNEMYYDLLLEKRKLIEERKSSYSKNQGGMK